MAQVPKIKLNTGAEMPMVGSGSYARSDPELQAAVKGWLLSALKAGYRHIDTAMGYGTEKAVGEAIRASGIPREEIFVTTKLPWNHHDKVAASFAESFRNLDIGYIDLYLIHWPQFIVTEPDNPSVLVMNPDGTIKTRDDVTFNDSWAEMEKLLGTGKVKAIGVSNFSIKTLEKLFETAKIVPAVNQVEMHPYLAQNDLRKYCAEKGIVIAAYTPSGYSTVRNDPVIVELARKYNVSPNQVTLSWHISRGTVIVAKSVDPNRQKENISLITLDEEDIAKIDKLDRNERLCNKADQNGLVWGWTYEQLGW